MSIGYTYNVRRRTIIHQRNITVPIGCSCVMNQSTRVNGFMNFRYEKWTTETKNIIFLDLKYENTINGSCSNKTKNRQYIKSLKRKRAFENSKQNLSFLSVLTHIPMTTDLLLVSGKKVQPWKKKFIIGFIPLQAN